MSELVCRPQSQARAFGLTASLLVTLLIMLWANFVAAQSSASRGSLDDLGQFGDGQTTPPPKLGIPSDPNMRGPEGIEFQPIALDTSVACSATLVKGSRRFQNTIFVFPRVLVSTNPKGDRLFEINRLPGDKYLVRFSVYFPRTDQDLRINDADVGVSLRRCNLDEVKRAVNTTGGGATNGSSMVQTVSRVPISTIDVQVDGLRAPFTLGAGPASMFNYQDSGHVVEFELANRTQLEGLLARVQSEIGLGIHVAMRFNARTADGGATITIDLRNLAAHLAATLRGRPTIAFAQLQAILSTELKKMNVSIQTESGPESTQGMADSQTTHQMVVNQLMNLVTSIMTTDGGFMPVDTNCGYGACPPGELPPSTRPVPPKPLPTGANRPISVSALVDALNKRGSYRFEYNNVGASETFVYRTSVYFRGEIADPDLRRYQISSGEKRITAQRLEKDATISLIVPEVQRAQLAYRPTANYFTSSQLREYGLHKHFDRLRDEKVKITDHSTSDGLAARAAASDRRWEKEYLVWGQGEVNETITGTSVIDVAPTRSATEKIPLSISFDSIGSRKFRLDELARDNVYWSATFDEVGGRILLKPKQNLGQMTVRNTAEETTKNIQVRWLFEERRDPKKGVIATKTANVVSKVVPTTRTNVLLMIGMPSQDGDPVDLVASHRGSQLDARVYLPIQRVR